MCSCKNEPLISVIVPVYKVEKYIYRCVDSIMAQVYSNLEIILVDDGSPDNCGKICDDYMARDKRITVIHKENGGLSDARNIAIRRCTGKYITFIDSDDWVSKFYVTNLYNAIKQNHADLSICGFINVNEQQTVDANENANLENYELLSREMCYKRLLYQNGVETSAWGKLYKKEIFEDLEYPVGRLYEDIPVTTMAIQRSDKIALIRNSDYFYFQRADSIQYIKFSHRKMDAITHMNELQDFIECNYPQLTSAARCRIFCTACNLVFSIGSTSENKEDFEILWNIVKKYRNEVLLNREARTKARIAALLAQCGYSLCKRVYRFTQMRGKI